jgi:hypothetical protein
VLSVVSMRRFRRCNHGFTKLLESKLSRQLLVGVESEVIMTILCGEFFGLIGSNVIESSSSSVNPVAKCSTKL